MAYGTAQATLA